MKFAVITVSDRAANGTYADKSGPAIVAVLKSHFPEAQIEVEVVPDGVESVLGALARHTAADWILTTGGTGPSPRAPNPRSHNALVRPYHSWPCGVLAYPVARANPVCSVFARGGGHARCSIRCQFSRKPGCRHHACATSGTTCRTWHRDGARHRAHRSPGQQQLVGQG